MSASAPAPLVGTAGDAARRRAARAFLIFLVALPLSYLLFSRLEPIWARILPLEGAVFMLAATLLGAVLALTPLAAAIGFLLAVWHGVESVYLPRSRPSPLLDRGIVAGGLLVWFSPALALLAAAIRGLIEGKVHFVRPPRDYLLATDPHAFWQSIGFFLIMGALFALMAWRYWRGKLAADAATERS